MKAQSTLILIFVLTLTFLSCNKAIPTGFWKNYKSELLVKNISDQEPYGGHRAMYWKVDKSNVFSSKSILEFAIKNDWTLVDSAKFNQEQVDQWTYNKKPIFPLTFKGFSDTTLNDATVQNFPRWFGGQIIVYKFRTGWVTIEPGTNNSINENGFVLVNETRNEMAVYHLWGD